MTTTKLDHLDGRTYTYRGADSLGKSRTGTFVGDLQGNILRGYNNGWRWLIVQDDTGDEVGGISRQWSGRRTWWSETP